MVASRHLINRFRAAAIAALTLELSPDDLAALEASYIPHAVVGFS